MLNTDEMKVSVEKTFTVGELWEAVFGSDGAGMVYWANKIRKPNGKGINIWKGKDFEPNPQDFKVWDLYESKWHEVSLENLRYGYELAIKEGQTHCGGYKLDIEDSDACFGDMVIQYAIFEKLVYG